jgi:hypothetical protein
MSLCRSCRLPFLGALTYLLTIGGVSGQFIPVHPKITVPPIHIPPPQINIPSPAIDVGKFNQGMQQFQQQQQERQNWVAPYAQTMQPQPDFKKYGQNLRKGIDGMTLFMTVGVVLLVLTTVGTYFVRRRAALQFQRITEMANGNAAAAPEDPSKS